MTPLTELQAQRIAVIKPSALGDIVHSLPVLTALRQRFPAARITWVVNRGYQPLLEGHPDLDATLPFDRTGRARMPLENILHFGRFLSQLRRQRFDLVIDLQGLLRSAVMTWATGSARRVGLDSAREGARYGYSDLVPLNGMKHAVGRYWRIAEALGVGGLEKQFRFPAFTTERAWAFASLVDMPRPWLFFGVGARWLTKRWPPEHFAALARKAQAEFGGTVVLIGAPDERSLSECVACLVRGPVRDFTGKTTIPQLAALLTHADVLAANDTGPLHLAAALGRPVVAPYTCTQVALTGPYANFNRCVETQVWCAGSLRKKCDRLECLAELTPARLWPALEEVLVAWQQSCRSA